MNKAWIKRTLMALIVLSMPAWAKAGGEPDEGDVFVGRTSLGQLTVDFDFGPALPLPAVDAFFKGWSDIEPGFNAPGTNSPADDFFPIDAGSEIHFVLDSIARPFRLYSPGLGFELDSPGDSFLLGTAGFDTHPTYHIDSEDPAFDPGVDSFLMSFHLVDVGSTGYAPSESFTATFTPVPEPASILLLGLGSMALLQKPVRRAVRRMKTC